MLFLKVTKRDKRNTSVKMGSTSVYKKRHKEPLKLKAVRSTASTAEKIKY